MMSATLKYAVRTILRSSKSGLNVGCYRLFQSTLHVSTHFNKLFQNSSVRHILNNCDMEEPDMVEMGTITEEAMNAMHGSSEDAQVKKNASQFWTGEEDQLLHEACSQHGNQWNIVSPYVGREKEECIKRWKSIIPEDWKSFTNIAWDDDVVLQLIEATHQARFDHTKGTFSRSKPINWYHVAALMNEEKWIYDSTECYEIWLDVQGMPASRMGEFSELEDAIILRRVKQWGKSHNGKWQRLSGELKRDYRQLNGRWRTLTQSKAGQRDRQPERRQDSPQEMEVEVEAAHHGAAHKRPLSKKIRESVEVFY